MTATVTELYRKHLSVGRARVADMTGGATETASAGSRVYDADGTEYLDCGGYGVFILGHRHPRVVDAVIDQIHRHPMATRLLLEPVAASAAEALMSVAPTGLDRVHFVNSGAEAVEAAIKLTRILGRTTLITATGGFHGKTMGALSLTAHSLYQDPFRPLLPDVHEVPYGDADALESLVARHGERACVFLEPVQGEGGVVIPPDGYLRRVARCCRDHGALFVLDEIQTGLGRLGEWWGADREGVRPDLLLAGKGLSGGVIPVAAMLATDEAYQPFSKDPFLHSSTYAGSPVAMAAARASVRTLREEGLVDRGRALGQQLIPALREISDRHLAADVRGAGLLIGIELPEPQVAGDLVLELMQRHVLVNHSLNAHHIARLTPPAVLSDEDVAWLLEAYTEAARAVGHRHGRRARGETAERIA